MITLTQPTADKIQVITSSTADLDVHASFAEADLLTAQIESTGETFSRGNQRTAIVTATTTDVLAAPASNKLRLLSYLNCRNKHASTSNDVTVQMNSTGPLLTQFIKVTLLAGESLVYSEGTWFHYDTNGGVYAAGLTNASDTVAGVIMTATQAEQEAGASLIKAVTPGRQHFHPSACKAWGKFGITGNILDSYNVTSIADTGTGIVTVTIANDFSTANWVCLVSVEAPATTWAVANTREPHIRFGSQTVTAIAFDCVDNTATTSLIKDPQTWHFAAFGDL